MALVGVGVGSGSGKGKRIQQENRKNFVNFVPISRKSIQTTHDVIYS